MLRKEQLSYPVRFTCVQHDAVIVHLTQLNNGNYAFESTCRARIVILKKGMESSLLKHWANTYKQTHFSYYRLSNLGEQNCDIVWNSAAQNVVFDGMEKYVLCDECVREAHPQGVEVE